jgi:hypothetical protein
MAGLLAALVTALPAAAHAVAAEGAAVATTAKPQSTSTKTGSKASTTQPAATDSRPAPARKVAGSTAGKSGPAPKTGAAKNKGVTHKTAGPRGRTTAPKKTTAAKTRSAVKAGVAKRSAGAATASSGGAPAVTAAAVRSSGLLAQEQSGATEALCYRRTTGRGRCEPQCLPYTRCRSGISTCRTGHENGPVTWFRCEQSRGNTSLDPGDGRILVLGGNKHNMPTGHTLYVERVAPRDDGRYDLILSHTNYDRRCNLETNVAAVYDKDARTIDMQTGNWAPWGRDLKVAGFILN